MGDMRNNRRGVNTRINREVQRGCNMGDRRMVDPPNCKNLMKKLQAVDFAIVDTILYLNAYPTCPQALDYYKKLVKERESLCEVINERCGPITAMSNKSHSEWNWVLGPWPWEPEAN